jgi:alkaline phosphatase D
LGVASGDPSSDGAVLWCRYDGSESLSALVWRADLDEASVTTAGVLTNGLYVTAVVSGLNPDTPYAYAFATASGHRSPEGRFRTAPAPGTRPTLTLGAISCVKMGLPFDVLTQAARRKDLSAFLMLGDTIYADGSRTLEDYRAKWAEAFATPEYQALRAATPIITTWDDHEFSNNWSGDSIDPALYDAGSRAFFDHMPLRAETTPIWRSLKLGDTAEIFVLDCRSERVRATGQYLSRDQLDWLKNGLLSSTATFKLILNSVPIATYDVPLFQPFATDRWEGFNGGDRAEILSHIDDNAIRGVLWISGDFHFACCGRVALSGPGANATEILVGPGAQVPNPSPSYPDAPQFDWSSGVNNYTELALDPNTGIAKATWLDAGGRILWTTQLPLAT